MPSTIFTKLDVEDLLTQNLPQEEEFKWQSEYIVVMVDLDMMPSAIIYRRPGKSGDRLKRKGCWYNFI